MDTERDVWQEHSVHVKEEWEEGMDTQQEHNVQIKVEWEDTDGQQEHRVLIKVEPLSTGDLNPSSEGVVKEESAALDLYTGHKVEGDLALGPETLQTTHSTFIQPTCSAVSAGHERPGAQEPANTHFKPYCCNVCTKGFSSKNKLERHIETETHARIAKMHSCEMCTQQFNTARKLIEHKRIHRDEKRYTCDHCMKRFAFKAGLVGHLLSHTREKPYSCGMCKKRFKCKFNLVAHERKHIRKKPAYSCDECTKRFTCEINLMQHKLSHVPKFDMESFQKMFKSLAQHIRVHNSYSSYSCEVCKKRFSRSESFVTHIRTHAVDKYISIRQSC